MIRRKLARRLGWVVGALVLLVASSWLAGCMLIESGVVLEVLNRRPEKLLVAYGSVRSPWPGRLVVEDFWIRVQTKKLQWLATAGRIEGDLHLLPLLGKRFVASDVAAEGIVFRLRRRLDVDAELSVPGDQMPPIAGFDNPPRPPPEEIYDLPENRRRWTIALHDWRLADVREIWIDQFRYRGRAAVTGGYTVRLKRTIRVRPTRFSFHDGSLRLGENIAATEIEGSLELASDRFRHRELRGIETITAFDSELEVEAAVPDLSFFADHLPDRGLLSDLSGAAHIAGQLTTRKADAIGSGRLDVRGRHMRLPYAEGAIVGNLVLAGRFPRIDFSTRRLDLAGTTVGISGGRMVKTGAEEEGEGEQEAPWWLRAVLADGSLRPGEPVPLEAVMRVRMVDSRPLGGLFVLRGKVPGWMEEALRVGDVRGEAALRVGDEVFALDHFHAEAEDVAVKGRLLFDGDGRRGTLVLSYRDLDLGVELRGADTNYKFTDVEKWFTRTVSASGD